MPPAETQSRLHVVNPPAGHAATIGVSHAQRLIARGRAVLTAAGALMHITPQRASQPVSRLPQRGMANLQDVHAPFASCGTDWWPCIPNYTGGRSFTDFLRSRGYDLMDQI